MLIILATYSADPNSGVCVDSEYIHEHTPAPPPPVRRSSRVVFTPIEGPVPARPEEYIDEHDPVTPPARRSSRVVFTPIEGLVPTRPEEE